MTTVAALPQISSTQLKILGALALAERPMTITEIYSACKCEGDMTSYAIAIMEMNDKGWLQDTFFGPLATSLTRQGRFIVLSLVTLGMAADLEINFGDAAKNWIKNSGELTPHVEKTSGYAPVGFAGKDGAAVGALRSLSDPWTEAHQRVFGIKPFSGERAGNASEPCNQGDVGSGSAAMTSPGIHLVSSHKPIVKTKEPCVTCFEPTTGRCAECEFPICSQHGYGDEKNLCSVCQGEIEAERMGEVSHGRADVR